ncbi:unnamed protein product [Diatraea saccharalis]|uniref:Uncharacterized protein n=1 Tax=Diatraea saccharalis TaxID=40085 RepID=A0A9P0FZN5_9NEOP|nr:unnamed protein product [Diatraea saccharalis]
MWRRKQDTESIRSSDSTRKRSSTPEKKRNSTPERSRSSTPERKRFLTPDGRRNATPERRRRSSEPSLSKKVNQPSSYSKTAIKRSNSPKIKEDSHRDKSKSNLKVKLKNKGQGTQEVYPVNIVKTRNKRSLTDNSKFWQTVQPDDYVVETDKSGETVGHSKSEKRRRKPLKVLIRRRVWNMSKRNSHWKQLLEDNNIDIEKINIDKVDLSLINVDGLGIENKFLCFVLINSAEARYCGSGDSLNSDHVTHTNPPIETSKSNQNGGGRNRCCPYDFDSRLCKSIGDRILCGYDRNIGRPHSGEEINLSQGCRIRGGRLECGYVNGPFTNPRRPPGNDDDSFKPNDDDDDYLTYTEKEQGQERLIHLKSTTTIKRMKQATKCLEIHDRIVCRSLV